MEIKFYNLPQPKPFNSLLITEKPSFVEYRPDFVLLKKIAEKFQYKKNLIIIGHGGSITTFLGIYNALEYKSSKRVFFISTIDPDYITKVKKQANPEDTVVIAISKSGETVTQLEALMAFSEFEQVFITGAAGPLAEIAGKLGATTIVHPPIGGRFTGLTEVALLPAALCGFDIEAVYQSGQELLTKFLEDNIVYELASAFSTLEEDGVVEIFMPFYKKALFPFSNLIVQLCHESYGKDGRGQTFFAHEAPESQHHTNQRFFGGRKNIAGWFVSTTNDLTDIQINVPSNLSSISLKDKDLSLLDKTSLSNSLRYEKDATIEDAKVQNITIVDMQLASLSEKECGQLIAFWQMFAVYSASLRGVNPFDQPQVENSKAISFNKRLAAKGHL